MWPRANLRLYVLLLCSVYFAMLYVFHGRLQYEINQLPVHPNPLQTPARNTDHGDGQHLSDPKRKVLQSGSRQSLGNESKQLRVLNLPRQTSSRLKAKWGLKTGDSVENQSVIATSESIRRTEKSSRLVEVDRSCFLSAHQTDRQFQKVEAGIFVYSAYLDERKNGTRIIRVMSVLSQDKKNRVIEMFCQFHQSGVPVRVKGTFYELCENHGKKFGGFVISCIVPKNVSNVCHINISVTITSLSSRFIPGELTDVTLPVTELQPSATGQMFNYTVCVPPLFGNISPVHLIEFIELNKILGFQHFIFYDFNILNKDTSKVLDAYSSQGTVTLIKWGLPSVIQNSQIWYHGQLSAHNDCLYRAMSFTDYLAIIDIDEYLIPHNRVVSLGKSVGSLFSTKTCGLSFDSAFYDPRFSESKLDTQLITASRTGRSSVFSKVRTKVLVDPRKIFEVGIHHISKPLEEDYKVERVNTSTAFLHHYRACVPNYGMKCSQHETDNTTLQFYANLKFRVEKVLKDVLHSDMKV